MTLTRVLFRQYGGYVMRTYECAACRVAYTVSEPDDDKKS